MPYTVGIKLTITDNDGKPTTSPPAYIKAESYSSIIDISMRMMHALSLLTESGVVHSYAVVLQCEADQPTKEAGQ